jgi:hypothetical protein
MPVPALGPWVNLPLTTSTQQSVRELPWIAQFYSAIREREWAVGRLYFPTQSSSWYSGVVSGATATTITDSSQTSWDGTGDQPFASGEAGNVDGAPGTFDIVIEGADSTDQIAVVRARITNINPATDTLTITDITDYVTSNEIGSFSDLIGRPYHCIPSYGYWWSDRWPAWANAQELWRGTSTAQTTTTLTQARANWPVNFWTGAELNVRASVTPFLHKRVQIISNTNDTLTFADGGFTPRANGFFTIVSANVEAPVGSTRYRLEHEIHQPFRWYAGHMGNTFMHGPFGIQSLPVPTNQVEFSEAELIEFCEPPTLHDTFDNDLISNPSNACAPGEVFYAPNIYKTWRMIQLWLERNCGSFVEKRSSLSGLDGLPYFTPATLFHQAQIGVSAEGSITAVDEEEGTFTIDGIDVEDFPFYPISVFFAVRKYDGSGDVVGRGRGTLINSTTFVVDAGDLGADPDILDPDFVSFPIVVSTGWTRFTPREVWRIYPASGFIPDVIDGVAVTIARVDDWEETQELGTGTYISRGPSETYTAESGDADGAQAFVVGEMARYVGLNWNDPIEGGSAGGSTIDPQLPFFDYVSYEGQHAPPLQQTMVEDQKSGSVTASSTKSITDDSKDWWTNHPNGAGVGHVESGTASSGSSTSLTDTTKVPGTEAGAFVRDERFINYGGPYVGFSIEVEIPTEVTTIVDGEPVVTIEDVWHQRPILTASSGVGGFTCTWSPALPEDANSPGSPASANGRPWRIRESISVNRWKSRGVIITPPGATYAERIYARVTHSSDNTLWLETELAEAPPVGSAYFIVQIETGPVLKFQTTQPSNDRRWVKIATNQYWLVVDRGDDVVRTGVPDPVPFHFNSSENLPTIVRRFGNFQKRDYADYCEFYNQLYRAINAMVWTKSGVTWHSSEDPEVEIELNRKTDPEKLLGATPETPAGGPCELPGHAGTTASALMDENVDEFNGDVPGWPPEETTVEASGPMKNRTFGIRGTAEEMDAGLLAQYAWADVTDPPEGVPLGFLHATDVYVLSGGPKIAHPGEVTPRYSDDPPEFFPGNGVDVAGSYFHFAFDAQGDNVIDGKWTAITSTAPQATFDRVKVGSNTAPPNSPTLPLTSELTYSYESDFELCFLDSWGGNVGYSTVDEVAIFRWDVAGGMSFIEPP